MNRRDLLRASAATATAGLLSSGMHLVDKGKAELGEPLSAKMSEKMSAKMKQLEERFDKLEHHHKNLVRIGGLAFAFSTGIDVVAFL